MIYFIIVTLIIAGDKFLKEYFRSSLRGKHRKEHFNQSGEGINRVNAMQDGWRRKLSPRIEFLENKGGASGILCHALLLCVRIGKRTAKRQGEYCRNRLCVTSWRRT